MVVPTKLCCIGPPIMMSHGPIPIPTNCTHTVAPIGNLSRFHFPGFSTRPAAESKMVKAKFQLLKQGLCAYFSHKNFHSKLKYPIDRDKFDNLLILRLDFYLFSKNCLRYQKFKKIISNYLLILKDESKF
jgi:hypothetical protein